MSGGVQADAEARQLAQREYERPVSLEAGAGTGKTAVLVARVCVWCLGAGWDRAAERLAKAGGAAAPERVASEALRRVVAITFTEAAAAEMAVRVGTALLDLRAGRPVLGIEAASLPQGESTLAERAGALVGALDQLGVRTIHAFCRRLLAAYALEAGLHPRFQVDSGGRDVEAVAREVMEAHLRRAFGAPGEEDPRELAAAGFGPAEVEEALLALLREGVPPELLANDPVGPEVSAAYLRDLARVLAEFVAVEDGALQAATRARQAVATASAVEAALSAVEAATPDADGLASLAAALTELVGDKNLDRLRDWGKGKLSSAAEREAWPGDVEPLSWAAVAARRWLKHARALDPDRLALGHRVVAPLLREALELLRRRGIETFSALLQDTERLLRSSPQVVSRVRRDIDQLLVDEFQDTDALQCEIVRSLALDGPPDERPGLFVVGDPKQSIYGWRNADLGAYEAFTESMAAAGGVAGRLSVNYRSVPAILDAVERVVAPVMTPEPGVQPAFERLLPCEALAGNAGFDGADAAAVEHWVSWGWDAAAKAPVSGLRAAEALDLEARAVARDLARLHEEAGVRWGSVALLFRSLSDVDTYLEELRRAGVPYVVERDRHYYDRREVIDASALVRALLDPHDQVALVAALRSSVVGVPDAALVPLWERGFPERFSEWIAGEGDRETLEKLVSEAVAAVPGGVPGLERVAGWELCLADFIDAASALRASCAQDPPDVFVERLRSRLRFEVSEASRSLGHFRVANLDRFFRDLRAALESAEGDLAHVLAALRHSVSDAREQEEGRPRPAGDDAVRVLTIHGAKGLQFEHVYALQLHKASGGRPSADAWVGRRGSRVALRLFEQETLDVPAVQAETDRVEEAEAVRTLYVAMTRAEHRLVLAGRFPPPGGGGRTPDGHAVWVARSAGPDGAGGDLEAWMKDAEESGAHWRDEAGARWVFPALDPSPPPRPSEGATTVPPAEALAEADRKLEERRREAAARAERPFRASASATDEAAADLTERAAAERYGEVEGEEVASPVLVPGGGEPLDRAEARAVGTAVHAALEALDAAAAPEAARRALHEALAQWLPADLSETARGRAQALLEGFLTGPLHERARDLAPHVVARELPVLLPPGPDAEALGFVAGAADLVYRDPDTLEWVVVDYKTDAVPSAGLREHAERHAAQGRVYVRAIREALGLAETPRFELWFLGPGEVVSLTL